MSPAEESMSGDIWTARVLTLFPEMFPGPLGLSLAGKALQSGLWRLETVNIRDHAMDLHGSVDDAPFGGGQGMVMRADVLDAAIDAGMLKGSSTDLPDAAWSEAGPGAGRRDCERARHDIDLWTLRRNRPTRSGCVGCRGDQSRGLRAVRRGTGRNRLY